VGWPLSYPGKRYNVADVSAAVCMSLGLIWFTLADSTIAPNFNLTGKEFIYIPRFYRQFRVRISKISQGF
jgi:hypothetical protein